MSSLSCFPSLFSGAEPTEVNDLNVQYFEPTQWTSQGSSHGTTLVGASAVYEFTGTGIQVFAHTQSNGSATFVIDNDGQVSLCMLRDNTRVAVWGTSSLSLAQHSLQITNLGEQLILDSIVVIGGGSPRSSSQTDITATPSSASRGTTTHTTANPASTLASTPSYATLPQSSIPSVSSNTTLPLAPSPTSTRGSRLRVGGIVGIAVAGAFFLSLIVCWFLYKKRANHRKDMVRSQPLSPPTLSSFRENVPHTPSLIMSPAHGQTARMPMSSGQDYLAPASNSEFISHIPSTITHPDKRDGPRMTPQGSSSSPSSGHDIFFPQHLAIAVANPTYHTPEPEATPAPYHGVDHAALRRRAQDGGIRIAGGPLGHDTEEDMDSQSMSTLPPEYSFQ